MISATDYSLFLLRVDFHHLILFLFCKKKEAKFWTFKFDEKSIYTKNLQLRKLFADWFHFSFHEERNLELLHDLYLCI